MLLREEGEKFKQTKCCPMEECFLKFSYKAALKDHLGKFVPKIIKFLINISFLKSMLRYALTSVYDHVFVYLNTNEKCLEMFDKQLDTSKGMIRSH